MHDLLPAVTDAEPDDRDGRTSSSTTPAASNLPATGLEGAAIGADHGASRPSPIRRAPGDETAADSAATIVWGDGTTSAGTVVSLTAAATTTSNAPAHTYVEEGTYTVTVR